VKDGGEGGKIRDRTSTAFLSGGKEIKERFLARVSIKVSITFLKDYSGCPVEGVQRKPKQDNNTEGKVVISEMCGIDQEGHQEIGRSDGVQLCVEGRQAETVTRSYLSVTFLFQIIKAACSPVFLRDASLQTATTLMKMPCSIRTQARENLSPQGRMKR
jgi:hypothetical protein